MREKVGSIISAQLDSQETLLWSGQPKQGIVFQRSDVLAIPLSIMWGGFTIYWQYSLLGTSLVFQIVNLPFFLVGLYVIFGRFLIDATIRKRVYYGITNERVIIVSEIFEKDIKTLPLNTLTHITFFETSEGVGTMTFGPTSSYDIWFENASWPGIRRNTLPRLKLIKHVKAVHDLIRKTQKLHS